MQWRDASRVNHIDFEAVREVKESKISDNEITASQRMRNASREAHAALETTPVAKLLMSPSLSAYDYWRVLDAWLIVWAPLERIVKSTFPSQLSVNRMPVMRSSLLRQDLRGVCDALGEFPQSRVVLADSKFAINDLATLASKWSGWIGIAYVLQGSILGGAVVASHLQRTLPKDIASCIRFFCPHTHASRNLAADFRLWMQWLDSELTDSSDQEHASYTAVRTFEFLVRSWNSYPSKQ